jgi:hypothetical protein
MRYGKRFAKEIGGRLEMHASPRGQVTNHDDRQMLGLIAQAVNRLLDESKKEVPSSQPAPPPTESKKRADRPLMVPFRAGSQSGRVKC